MIEERSFVDREAPLLVSVREAAKLLGVSRSTLYILIATNRLATVLICRRRLVSVKSLRELAAGEC